MAKERLRVGISVANWDYLKSAGITAFNYSDTVQRSVCSCGFVSSNIVSVCPDCGNESFSDCSKKLEGYKSFINKDVVKVCSIKLQISLNGKEFKGEEKLSYELNVDLNTGEHSNCNSDEVWDGFKSLRGEDERIEKICAFFEKNDISLKEMPTDRNGLDPILKRICSDSTIQIYLDSETDKTKALQAVSRTNKKIISRADFIDIDTPAIHELSLLSLDILIACLDFKPNRWEWNLGGHRTSRDNELESILLKLSPEIKTFLLNEALNNHISAKEMLEYAETYSRFRSKVSSEFFISTFRSRFNLGANEFQNCMSWLEKLEFNHSKIEDLFIEFYLHNLKCTKTSAAIKLFGENFIDDPLKAFEDLAKSPNEK